MQFKDKPALEIDYTWRTKFAWFPKRLADRWIWLEKFERSYVGMWCVGDEMMHHFMDRLPGNNDTKIYSVPWFTFLPVKPATPKQPKKPKAPNVPHWSRH